MSAALENKEGKYLASAESCSAALASVELPENLRAFVPDPSRVNSYPISTFSWILLRKNYGNAETAAAVRALFRSSLQEGQSSTPAMNYVPLPRSVVMRSLAAVDSITAGGY
jgi:phosphate transport system substrate-binding protein